MTTEWEELDVGELYLKKVKSTRPQRGTNAQNTRARTLTPEEYKAAKDKEDLAKHEQMLKKKR